MSSFYSIAIPIYDTLWRVRRKPDNHHRFEVFCFLSPTTNDVETVSVDFDTAKSAQEFADAMNEMRKAVTA